MDNLANIRSSALGEANTVLAVVVDNNDPTKKQRVRVTVPGLLESATLSELPWVLPKAVSAFGVGDDYGVVQIPRIGSRVYVHFQKGDLSMGQYVADALVSSTQLPADLTTNYPHRVGFFSPKGDVFYMDMSTNDTVFKHSSGSAVHFAPNGAVTLYVKGDLTQVVDGNYAQVVKGNSSVSVDGDHSISVKGNRTEVIQKDSNVTVSGTCSETSSGARTISCSEQSHSGDITVLGDVNASGISLRTHVHPAGVPRTGPPV